MSFKKLEVLSINPFLLTVVLENFLIGHKKECSIEEIFYVFPMVLHAPTKEKLLKCNTRSRMDTAFSGEFKKVQEYKGSNKVSLMGVGDRLNEFKKLTMNTITILSNEGKIIMDFSTVKLINGKKYVDFKGSKELKDISKAAYYLGVIFEKERISSIKEYLGVEK